MTQSGNNAIFSGFYGRKPQKNEIHFNYQRNAHHNFCGNNVLVFSAEQIYRKIYTHKLLSKFLYQHFEITFILNTPKSKKKEGKSMIRQHKTLGKLFLPICLETLFYMLAGMVDTLMLSSVGNDAVGAVGTANTYIGVFIIMFSVISTGVMAVMTQNIGAKRNGVAYQAKQIGLICNAILGGMLGIFLFFYSGNILHMISVSPGLFDKANIYMQIVGGACIFHALIPIFSGYLRAFGYTQSSLYASVIGNIVNFILNAIFLYLLHWGVAGVAFATVISKVINLCIVILQARIMIHAHKSPERIKNKEIFKQILKIGFPSAMETAIYNIAMTLVIRYLNQMDTNGFNVAARSYTAQITNFSFCAGAALAQANAIMTGWFIGAGEYEKCDKTTKKSAKIGIGIAIMIAGLIALFGQIIMLLFTSDQEMIQIVVKLLFIDVILEIGRVTNLIFGNALKTSGDTFFPMFLAAIFMFSCAAGGTYLFGLRLHLLVIGAYIGLTADECIRAIAMYLRWNTGKWKNHSFI